MKSLKSTNYKAWLVSWIVTGIVVFLLSGCGGKEFDSESMAKEYIELKTFAAKAALGEVVYIDTGAYKSIAHADEIKDNLRGVGIRHVLWTDKKQVIFEKIGLLSKTKMDMPKSVREIAQAAFRYEAITPMQDGVSISEDGAHLIIGVGGYSLKMGSVEVKECVTGKVGIVYFSFKRDWPEAAYKYYASSDGGKEDNDRMARLLIEFDPVNSTWKRGQVEEVNSFDNFREDSLFWKKLSQMKCSDSSS